ncbi:GAP family protein [Streptomyces sp. NPDC048057]|uniref:GAP family protein n=1 Tax=Streptomyces sp. NPDC048057 TaxID=3155628 RepID=UPI0033F4993E
MLGLAVVDSLNPSALAVTLYLVLTAKPFASRVLAYVGGIFSTYLAIGTLLMLGLDVAGAWIDEAVSSDASFVVQGVIGVGMVIYGSFPPGGRNRPPKERKPRSLQPRTVFFLGVGITLVEFSTAFPYIAALGVIGGSDMAFYQWFPLLVGYNLVMVLPPLLIAGVYGVLRERVEPLIVALGERLRRGARKNWLDLCIAVGVILILSCVAHFDLHEVIKSSSS